jgi:A/G-specific adenine glycosylase
MAPVSTRQRQIKARIVRHFQKKLLDWFTRHGRKFPWRRSRATLYTQIIAELLLQRTRAEMVSDFLPEFLKRFPSWHRLARASERDIGAMLKPIGLWRRRAKSLKQLAMEMSIRKGRYPRDRLEIESLPGVGQYITNAIMLFCHEAPEPLLDVNMARVLERYFGPRTLADIRYDPYLQDLARRVLFGTSAEAMNWAILDLAATICTTRSPLCTKCPVSSGCLYGRVIKDSYRK